jgi:hypothetical protein
MYSWFSLVISMDYPEWREDIVANMDTHSGTTDTPIFWLASYVKANLGTLNLFRH